LRLYRFIWMVLIRQLFKNFVKRINKASHIFFPREVINPKIILIVLLCVEW
jgi:hypothetical protein